MLTDTVPRQDEAYRRNGNVLLDDIFGATIHRLPAGADALATARDRAATLISAGRRPYVVGSGGSSPVGCLGYAACAAEIAAQERELGLRFDRINVPNGSSGTHAGLPAGLKAIGDSPARVTSFTVLAPLEQAHASTLQLAEETLKLLAPEAGIRPDEIVVLGDQLGRGYGEPRSEMLEAVRLVARSEGLLLDPVYGGKAFAGLIAGIRHHGWTSDAPMLFVMTGGVPGLFAYEPAFQAG